MSNSVTPWTIAHQAPLSMGFFRPEILEWVAISFSRGSSQSRDWTQVAQRLKHLPPMWESWVQSLGWEDPLEKEMATYSSILAWRIPWTEKLGRLQSTGSQRVRHDWVTSLLDHLIHQGSPRILEWVAYPFSNGSSQSRNQTWVSCIAGWFFTSWATREAQEAMGCLILQNICSELS